MQYPFPPGYIPNLKDDSPYGYQPTLWITILFVVLFSLTTSKSTGVYRTGPILITLQ